MRTGRGRRKTGREQEKENDSVERDEKMGQQGKLVKGREKRKAKAWEKKQRKQWKQWKDENV